MSSIYNTFDGKKYDTKHYNDISKISRELQTVDLTHQDIHVNMKRDYEDASKVVDRQQIDINKNVNVNVHTETHYNKFDDSRHINNPKPSFSNHYNRHINYNEPNEQPTGGIRIMPDSDPFHGESLRVVIKFINPVIANSIEDTAQHRSNSLRKSDKEHGYPDNIDYLTGQRLAANAEEVGKSGLKIPYGFCNFMDAANWLDKELRRQSKATSKTFTAEGFELREVKDTKAKGDNENGEDLTHLEADLRINCGDDSGSYSSPYMMITLVPEQPVKDKNSNKIVNVNNRVFEFESNNKFEPEFEPVKLKSDREIYNKVNVDSVLSKSRSIVSTQQVQQQMQAYE